MNIGIVGVGLIGGSIGLAARARAGAHVRGFDAGAGAIEAALAAGAIDRGAGDVSEAVADADAVFVATPVGALGESVLAALDAAPAGCVVSDVGSTKQAIVGGTADQRFVGGHPLAGSEGAGVRLAREDMFAGATWYLTPTSLTSGVLYERLHRLLTALGAAPAAIDAASHDRLMASFSHLPHVLANVLVDNAAGTVDDLGGVSGGAEESAGAVFAGGAPGPSFRDATRVAGANSTIWKDIYLSNRDELVPCIDRAIDAMTEVRAMLARADAGAVAAWNDRARGERDRLLRADASGEEAQELRVMVPNRPGVVAEIALALGRAGVNISDMALSPSPDGSRGVIALWVRGAREAAEAGRLVGELGFAVIGA
ncbi:MAG: prephenate dehydrogenase/arogenate dehydrogenase family protein [Acidobacteriota bacterium]|nr:prephenate dehydrogenase/arogenate dehydrogenase family protein [Acidobacteriota bacterium]